MAIAAAIIGGVLGTASIVTSVVGSKAAAEEQKEALEEQREFQEEEAEKERKLKQQQLKQQGFEQLAGQRMKAEEEAAKRNFNTDMLGSMREVLMSRRSRKPKSMAPQMQTAGLPTTTFGRAA